MKDTEKKTTPSLWDTSRKVGTGSPFQEGSCPDQTLCSMQPRNPIEAPALPLKRGSTTKRGGGFECLRSWVFVLLLTIPFASFSQNFPERTKRLVNDYSNTLSKQEINNLEQKLLAYDRESSVQIAIVLIKTLDGYPIDQYAFELGEKWGIGQKESSNGALILVSMQERKMWIATGYGLEATLTDALSKRIIENEMKPRFRNNDYFGGLAAASEAMILATRGEYQGSGGNGENGGSEKKAPKGTFFIILLIFGFIWLMKARQVRSYARTNSLGFFAAWMLLNNSSRRHGGSFSSFSGGSGGFGGGGFGGFGGGSFGGGGAGGSW